MQSVRGDWHRRGSIGVHDRGGIGVADMAHALTGGRDVRASGAMGYHVLDVMHALFTAKGNTSASSPLGKVLTRVLLR